MVFDNVEDKLGYLILNQEGAVLASDGDLKNSEHTATVITNVLHLVDSIPPHTNGYNQLTITYAQHSYIVSLSNKKIYILKRRFNIPEEAVLSESNSSVVSTNISEDEEGRAGGGGDRCTKCR
uniref:Late endosomal/lysosomal adaptor and MAPK and MTOR activator 4 n=1 Tax=Cacopsylla melanoneura TaxID=428564 RepID=A0A8D9EBU7_9HEMI